MPVIPMFGRPSISLRTPRLMLDSLNEQDWPLFLQLYQDPAVQRYISDPMEMTEIRARFESRLMPWEKTANHWLCLVVREKQSGQAIGLTGFLAEWLPLQQAEVGYAILPCYQGKGFAKESLLAVLAFGFQQCQFHKMKATVTVGNQASRQMLERCGFQLEGTLRDNYQLAGQWCDDWVLGLLAGEFALPG
ncbi:N-acetyltransferase [Yersinia hibernica]|uniref:N-acetyltransferase n=2 Tax=Yersinia TaxID=629 RepID=A0A7U4GH13_YEREN|nr:N-acetyltransferase [Yersinia hibernica]OVZ90815.1 GNAT family N-acetyltransferase [Yersinia kristensenii]